MSDVRTPDDREQRAGQQRTRGGRRGLFLAGETEARPGVMTTEFWVTLLAAATVVIAGYVSTCSTRTWRGRSSPASSPRTS
jgi:hypothetical protein